MVNWMQKQENLAHDVFFANSLRQDVPHHGLPLPRGEPLPQLVLQMAVLVVQLVDLGGKQSAGGGGAMRGVSIGAIRDTGAILQFLQWRDPYKTTFFYSTPEESE